MYLVSLAVLATGCLFILLRILVKRVEFLDSDASLSAMELIRRWGYPVEEHNVTTDDGYILRLHRIPFGINQDRPSKPRPAILLMHGLHGSSMNWIINLPHQSAGFIFADSGYDVWLGNCRGNMYGQGHKWLDVNSKYFWDFTWEDMADHDIPSTVDYILNETGHSSIHYVGHSQGFAIISAQLAANEQFANKITEVFGVAPVWTNGYSWGPAVVMSYKMPYYEYIYRWFGSKQYHAKTSSFVSTAAKYICFQPGFNYACGFFIECFGGMPTLQINHTRTSVYMSTTPAGSSTKNMIHWAQICHRNKNLRFDYGEKKNMEIYGQPIPPSYNISKIRTPIHLFWSLEDWLADDKDIRVHFLDHVDPSIIKSAEIIPGFNHFDFILGTEAGDRIYRHILQRIDEGTISKIEDAPRLNYSESYCNSSKCCHIDETKSSLYQSPLERFQQYINITATSC